MVEHRVPHEVYYETDEPISISDVVESLLGIEELLKSTGPVLEACFPGLTVERIQVSIKEISEGSLREVVFAAIFLTFQKDLEGEVPKLIETLTGSSVGHEYPAITSIVFLLLLLYGADFAYRKIAGIAHSTIIQEQLDNVVTEICSQCSLSEQKLRKILDERFGKGGMRSLVRATSRVFRPAKRHGNSGFRVGGHRIEPRLVAEVPGDALLPGHTHRSMGLQRLSVGLRAFRWSWLCVVLLVLGLLGIGLERVLLRA